MAKFPAKPAKPAEPPKSVLPAPVPGSLEAIMRALNADFCGSVPEAARAGHYEVTEGDRFFDKPYCVPDAVYRVTGSEWLLKIEVQRFVSAARAAPPDFGGADVVKVGG